MKCHTATAVLCAALAALVLVFPGPASAAIDPASYLHIEVIRDYPAPYGVAGGYVSCPAHTKAVVSGVTSSGLGDVLTAGLTTFDGTSPPSRAARPASRPMREERGGTAQALRRPSGSAI